MSTSTASKPAPATIRHQRSAKNYLLDRHFQLKYTGYLMGVALFVSVVLGGVLYRTSSRVIEESQRTVEEGRETIKQGQETVTRGKELLSEKRKVDQVVAMNIAKEYQDDPELAKTFAESTKRDENKLNEEQKRLEDDTAFLAKRAQNLEQQARDVESQQRAVLFGLVAGLALLVLAIGVAGIVVTHKVAGPIFKMKRLLRQVGEGKLVVRERLRKGDELQHFFETFERMVEDLRKRQQAEIARVDEILDKLDQAPTSQRGGKDLDVGGVEMLRKLRAEMQEHIEA
ncbi:MAG TPA: HAMP domain-containing protein [Minicystis sp.]|nr:HAMP domain-containing protein [Minicystis sp.]